MGGLNCYIFIMAVNVAVLVIARDTIFVTDFINVKIWAAPLDTLEFEALPLQNIGQPVAVDFDPVDHKVYWTDVRRRIISRAKLDGTEQEVVVGYVSVPDGLTIDVVNRHIYWTDTGTNTTGRANLDGTGRQIILQDGHDEPRAIVVDSAGGRLFWTDWGTNPKIERSKLDGSGRKILVNTGLELPNGLTLDLEGNRIYWCDAGLNAIETTDLDGGNRINLFTIFSRDIHPFDIGIYNGYVYWSDWLFVNILKLNKYGERQATGVGTPVFERAGGLHIFIDTINECDSNPCNNEGMCIDEIDYYQCNCTGTGYQGDICQIVSSACKYPGDIQNGHVIPGQAGNIYAPGEKVEFTCADGYMPDGEKQAFCQSDGTWSDENPVCKSEDDVNECSQTPSPCHVNADCSNTEGSYTCHCQPGFAGDGYTTCTDTDECSSNPCQNGGTCNDLINNFRCDCSFVYEGVRCESRSIEGCLHPGELENGYVISGGSNNLIYPPGKRIEYLCEDNYELQGTKSIFCQTDSTWSHEMPVCVEEKDGLNTQAIIGGGVAVGSVIIILIIILLVVCCKKNQNTGANDLLALQRVNPPAPKPDNRPFTPAQSVNTINRAYEPGPSLYSHRIGFGQQQGTLNRIYDEIPGNGLYEMPQYDRPPSRLPPGLPPAYDTLRSPDNANANGARGEVVNSSSNKQAMIGTSKPNLNTANNASGQSAYEIMKNDVTIDVRMPPNNQ
ncbi:uncharacterized protein [Amphiura filiformis]|uniref:uncharacterized protein n=1 Tax=Amphiura filiformis TaxID=82378 RepID=UPI003B20C82E